MASWRTALIEWSGGPDAALSTTRLTPGVWSWPGSRGSGSIEPLLDRKLLLRDHTNVLYTAGSYCTRNRPDGVGSRSVDRFCRGTAKIPRSPKEKLRRREEARVVDDVYFVNSKAPHAPLCFPSPLSSGYTTLTTPPPLPVR